MIIISKISNLPLFEKKFTERNIIVNNTPLNILEKSESLSLKFLDSDERKSIERLPINSRVRADKLWTRILLKKLYARSCNIEEKDIKYITIVNSNEKNIRGLPYMNYKNKLCPVRLSISHCDGRVGVALRTNLCGLDIVKLFTTQEHMEESFIHYAFSAGERMQLSDKTVSEKLEYMTLIWGIKEAVSKYLGCGLVYGPATIEVIFNEAKSVDLNIHPLIIGYEHINNLNIYYYWNIHRTFCHVYVE